MEITFEKERRRWGRLKVHFPMRYRLLPNKNFSEFKKSSINVFAHDIGKGGIRFISEKFVPKSAKLLVESSPFSPYWRIKAEVSWVQKVGYSERYNIGLNFQDGGREIEEILNLYSE